MNKDKLYDDLFAALIEKPVEESANGLILWLVKVVSQLGPCILFLLKEK